MTKLCECGCGKPAPIAKRTRTKLGWYAGQPKRFIHGHNGRGRAENHYNWKGDARRLTTSGYRNTYLPDHPNAVNGSYLLEQRLVAEQLIGRELSAQEVVCHLDGDPLNNAPENLEVFPSRKELLAFIRTRNKR